MSKIINSEEFTKKISISFLEFFMTFLSNELNKKGYNIRPNSTLSYPFKFQNFIKKIMSLIPNKLQAKPVERLL